IDIGDEFEAELRTAELVQVDGSIGFEPDLIMPVANGPDALIDAAVAWLAAPKPCGAARPMVPAAPAFAPDRPYADMAHPSVEYRMLAAFRIWGVIHYFFPYKELIGEDWTDVLRAFIPRFQAAEDATDYAKIVAEMMTHARDAHCAVSSAK